MLLGFGAFLPTAYIGIAELGVIAGLGMVDRARLLSVTLLPALVVLVRPGAPRREVGFAALAPVDRCLARRPRGGAVALRACRWRRASRCCRWSEFDFNPLHLRDPDRAGDARRSPI